MTDDGNIGERRERALRNRRLWTFILLMLAGGIVGFAFAMVEGDGAELSLAGTIPPGIAIVFAVVTATAMIGGGLIYRRSCDEVDLAHNLYAGASGAVTMMIVYPVWFLLWKGDLVPEPQHLILFAIVYLTTTAVYLFRKFR